MIQRIILLLLVLLLLSGCASSVPEPACGLEMWVTTAENAQIYQSLAEGWNAENPDRPIRLTVSVYSSPRIAEKLDRARSVGNSFSSDSFPDLVEIDYASLPRHVFQQTTELYPLKNILDKHSQNTDLPSGVSLYSNNDICFALPYQAQTLVLCYRLDLETSLHGFQRQASSFEGLARLGSTYASRTGAPLLMVDYLGSEAFLALFVQALSQADDPQQAYEAALRMLEQLDASDASGYLPSGDAYAESFAALMEEGQIPCVITTCSNLLRLAQSDSGIGRRYGVLPLPTFQGAGCRVSVPTVGTAIPMNGEHVVLARDFLEFCRLSPAARDFPMLDLCRAEPDISESLSGLYTVHGNFDAPYASMPTIAIAADYLPKYSEAVLGREIPVGQNG